MFDEALDLEALLTVYSAVLVPVIFIQFLFFLSYIIRRIKRG